MPKDGYGQRAGGIVPSAGNGSSREVAIPQIDVDYATVFTQAFEQFAEDYGDVTDADFSVVEDEPKKASTNLDGPTNETTESKDKSTKDKSFDIKSFMTSLLDSFSLLANKPFALFDKAVGDLLKPNNNKSQSSSNQATAESATFTGSSTSSVSGFPSAGLSDDTLGVGSSTALALPAPEDTRETSTETFYETSNQVNTELMSVLVDPSETAFGEFIQENVQAIVAGSSDQDTESSDVSGKWTVIIAAISAAVVALSVLLKPLVDEFADFAGSIFPIITDFFEKIAPDLGKFAVLLLDTWSVIIDELAPPLIAFAQGGLGLLTDVFNGVGDVATSITGVLVTAVDSVGTSVVSLGSSIVDGLAVVLDASFLGVADIIDTTMTGIADSIGSVFDSIEAIVSFISSPFKLGTKLVNATGNIAEAGINKLNSSWFGSSKSTTNNDNKSSNNTVINNYQSINYSDMSPFSDMSAIGVN